MAGINTRRPIRVCSRSSTIFWGSAGRLRGIEIEISSTTTTNISISKTGFHTHKTDRQTLGHSSQPHFPNASRATGSLLSLRLSRCSHQSGNAGFPSQPWEYEPPPGEGGPGSCQVATPPAKAGNFNRAKSGEAISERRQVGGEGGRGRGNSVSQPSSPSQRLR